MILASYVVWRNKKAITISQITVGDKLAVLAEDKSVTYATVKSILPVHASCITLQLTDGYPLTIAQHSLLLSEIGYITPNRGDILICGKGLHRVTSVKNSLTRKQFYDIMLDMDLPLIFQDGYCIKVRTKI